MFVVYMGGTCGDIVSSMLDWTGCEFDTTHSVMRLPQDRQGLKKPHLFVDDNARDEYVQSVTTKYLSLPSHDLEYHKRKQHKFIGIGVSDREVANWAAERFKRCHRPHVWQEVERAVGINNVEQYAQLMLDYSNAIKELTSNILQLEDILSGQAVLELARLAPNHDVIANENKYQSWLKLIDKI